MLYGILLAGGGSGGFRKWVLGTSTELRVPFKWGGGGFAGCVRVLIDCLNVCVCVHHVYNNPHRLMMIEYYASSSRVCTCEDAHHHISTPRPR